MVGPTDTRPPVEEPPRFKSPAPAAGETTLPEEWWRLYRDPDLDRLIAMANASNQTLVQAVARVDEARALARVAASFRYPTVTVDAIHTRQRTSANRISQFSGQPVGSAATFNDWLVPGRELPRASIGGAVQLKTRTPMHRDSRRSEPAERRTRVLRPIGEAIVSRSLMVRRAS
jgi:outer membrane protein TolC